MGYAQKDQKSVLVVRFACSEPTQQLVTSSNKRKWANDILTNVAEEKTYTIPLADVMAQGACKLAQWVVVQTKSAEASRGDDWTMEGGPSGQWVLQYECKECSFDEFDSVFKFKVLRRLHVDVLHLKGGTSAGDGPIDDGNGSKRQ